MKIAFFGSSLTSSYWNGAATYYRGLLRALAERGHDITFYEPDAWDRQAHRDLDDPRWARVCVYPAEPDAVMGALEAARDADLVVKASGVGVLDELLEASVLALKRPRTRVVFWDVDAPATLARMRQNPYDPLRAHVPEYDLVFTYGGGEPVIREYQALGARACVPIYNAVDPRTHYPVARRARFSGLLGFLGNRLPDREAAARELFFGPAAALPKERFVLGGSGWDSHEQPRNVSYLGHVYTRHHNVFNCSPRAVLNINRESMATIGFSPPTRIFEAAGAGACIISDAWAGMELFLAPGDEVLIARNGEQVLEHLHRLTDHQARTIGARARARVLAEHTYSHRAADVEAALGDGPSRARAHDHGRDHCHDSVHHARHHDPHREPATSSAPAADHRDSDSVSPLASLDIVIIGLSITSSWGNGHATTYRGLMRELGRRGHRVLFLERDTPWYAAHRDLLDPPEGRTVLYSSLAELQRRFAQVVRRADLVIVGSYVPDGREIGEWVVRTAGGLTAFYDLDTPVTLSALEAGTCRYLSWDLIPHYGMYLSFTGGPVLTRLEREHGAPRALPLYCAADPTCHLPRQCRPTWDLGYMGTYSDDRQPALEELLLSPARRWQRGRFVVAGSQYPAGPGDIGWPHNVDHIEHLPPPAHAGFFGAQRFTLNLTRAPMRHAGYAPSVRLFEAALCGAPIISDVWPGIETFFVPGHEILLAHEQGDVLRYLTDLSEDERVAVAERARARVRGEHTAAKRAQTLERYVQELGREPTAGRAHPSRRRRHAAAMTPAEAG